VLVRDRAKPPPSAARCSGAACQRLPVGQGSVTESEEAADVLRWLSAVANPLDGALAAPPCHRHRGLSLAELARLSSDELAWESGSNS
jgi:ATP-dependent exoDNAse (exonuclease V) beta subunit